MFSVFLTAPSIDWKSFNMTSYFEKIQQIKYEAGIGLTMVRKNGIQSVVG